MNKPRILAAGVCSLGGLIFGYDLGALSAVGQSLRHQFHLSPALFGLTVSASLWGTVCGSLLAGRIADRAGRRSLVAGCAFFYMLAAGILALPLSTTSWSLILALRFLSGMTIGGFTVACPLYLAELAPDTLRGRFVGLFQIQIGIGVVLAFAAGSIFAHLTVGEAYWKWCLGLGVVPAALLLSLLRYMPQEPRWLASRGRWREGQAAAAQLRFSDVERQVAGGGVVASTDSSASRERLFSRKYRRPLLLATSIALFNQLSGVNILLFYLLDVLSSAGLNRLLSHNYTVFISCLNLGTTLLGMACVDRLGRKPLLLIGSVGMSLCLLSLGFAIPHHFAPASYLIILVAYNGFFAFSQGTVIWIYLSELFPFGVRGSGQGYGASVHWIANAVLVGIFPIFQHASPIASFYFFALMMALQAGVVLLWYPETKGVALGSVAGTATTSAKRSKLVEI